VDIISQLEQPRTYRPVFDRLRDHTLSKPHLLDKSPIVPELSLYWILSEERRVSHFLASSVRSRSIIEADSELHEALLDKRRLICSQSWPQRILQAALTSAIDKIVEPQLSDRLHSFRKGFGHFGAIHEFALFAKAATEDGKPLFVSRRDIKQYDHHIKAETFCSLLEKLIPKQSPFFWELLNSFLKPKLRGSNQDLIGIPMGFHLTPLVENVYLYDLDHEMERIPGLFYIRYGDDIIFAHPERETLMQALAKADAIVAQRNLMFHDVKRVDAALARNPRQGAHPGFIPARAVEYLGLNVYADGTTFLTDKKLKEVKLHFSGLTTIAYQTCRRTSATRFEILDSLINSLNVHFVRDIRHPYIETLLAWATNEDEIKKLDRWIAKQPLRHLYGSSHDRVFRHVSYRDLRKRGLKSLLHLRRLARRHEA